MRRFYRPAGVFAVLVAFATPMAITAASVANAKTKDFAFKSQSVEFPADEELFHAGPGAEEMINNCLACHSTEMIHYQPKLSRQQWEGVIKKMRDVYKAQINEDDVPALIEYLASMPTQAAGSDP